ncbi:hypothetical protein MTBSS4_40205 [Magnetospirillum sp. SS-4]|nr:hypothetical protein MTBSS4_40205 [Magnetospirillum sp. SS-4]
MVYDIWLRRGGIDTPATIIREFLVLLILHLKGTILFKFFQDLGLFTPRVGRIANHTAKGLDIPG